MLDPKEPYRAVMEHRIILGWSKYTLGFCALIGSWMSQSYEGSMWMSFILAAVSGWAALCHLSDGFSRGYVIYTSVSGILFIIAAIFSPAREALLIGTIAGTVGYLAILLYVTVAPRIEIGKSVGKFYYVRYPLQKLIPLMYLAPEILSPIFNPIAAFHWGLGLFGIPVMRFSFFDAMSVHKYILNQTMGLEIDPNNWRESVYSFRRAMGILNLLETLHRYEEADLDGVALAASARLALAGIASGSRETLSDVLSTLKPLRRKALMGAYDL
jgi:hypothetical protein